MKEKRPFFKSRKMRRFIIAVKRMVLPGFEGVPFLTVMNFFWESLVKGIIFQRAAAMTYRIFIALIPMLMALFAAISFLNEAIRIELLNFIQAIVPDYTWPAISGVITEVVMNKNGMLLYSSFALGLYMTVLCMNSIITSLNITYFKIQMRTVPKQLLVSLLMTLCFGIIIILVIAIFIGASLAVNHLNITFFGSEMLYFWTIRILKWVLILVLVYTLLSILFYFAPANKKYFRFFSAGATFSTLGLVILLTALNTYFYYFPTYNLIYGSIGALFAINLWLYWSCIIILIGFDLNVSIFAAKEKRKTGKMAILLEIPDNEKEK
ncbi:YihY/virulence factor BrkB family protein [Bacteroidales bacterium OttesenSCG-928-B11]|nr:YihY/virulence factor BrkB family protein [Bacteroidales bacterium OttesenSCG-928-E04]MDL2308199.1 YihY/virulence factor BrkB family protein [Bacteroidales bacterium OttesenSCG-928-C03]MDL2312587.1 YihY/virulence factor BrkB family protein [Bacteroidales bacterium OttesenSCG-928-B11]MDL2325637.1 YihY/virulence factor BrkB family protein [Bacteroidales bacterium OttesenSCG-928-A14]